MYRCATLITLSLMYSPGSFAQDQIDPTQASPDMYSVLLENEHVRVVDYRIEAGQRDEWHTHPAKVMYIVNGGELMITLSDGTSFPATEETGVASWMNAVGKHYAENVGSSTVHVVLVEIKSAEETLPE